jgi:hypothetical protein
MRVCDYVDEHLMNTIRKVERENTFPEQIQGFAALLSEAAERGLIEGVIGEWNTENNPSL